MRTRSRGDGKDGQQPDFGGQQHHRRQPGASITQVAFYYIDSSGTQQLLGYCTQTGPGVWNYIFTVNLTSGSYTLLAQAEDSYGVFGDPVALTH